jgi:hypothetical protein
MTYPPCGHAFCKASYKDFFDFQIKQSGQGYVLKCPQQGCGKVITDDFLRSVVDEKTYAMFKDI